MSSDFPRALLGVSVGQNLLTCRPKISENLTPVRNARNSPGPEHRVRNTARSGTPPGPERREPADPLSENLTPVRNAGAMAARDGSPRWQPGSPAARDGSLRWQPPMTASDDSLR